ncbi:hypothetical protein BGW37DRAFT_465371 [Umbelopsis sp. PMI_123]|nr:hypothetical protein BGW37DRAFT_465371 [Umbelopsis sp. PMI_123]
MIGIKGLSNLGSTVNSTVPLVLVVLESPSAIAGVTAAVLAGSNNKIFAYSTIGIYVVAQQVGKTLPGRLWKAFFPGDRESLATVLGLVKDSKYVFYGLLSGTQITPFSNIPDNLQKLDSDEHKYITINSPRRSTTCTIDVFRINGGYQNGDILQNTSANHHTLISLIASLASISINFVILWIGDLYAFIIMSLLGASTFALTRAISSGGIKVMKHNASNVSMPAGLGIISNGTNHLKVLVGEENDVNCITKTRLELKPKSSFSLGVICATIYTVTIAQLFILPQASPATQVLVLVSYLLGYIANVLHSSYDLNDSMRKLVQEESGTEYVATIVGSNRAAALAAVSLLTGAVNEDVYQSVLAKEAEWRRWISQLQQVVAKQPDQWKSELHFTKETEYTVDIEAAVEGVLLALASDEKINSFQMYSWSTARLD